MGKMLPSRIIVSGVILVAVCSTMVAGRVGEKCTDKNCDAAEYCDSYSYECRSCAKLCADNMHTCREKCKDYIVTELEQQLSKLQTSNFALIIVTWVISAAAVLLAIALLLVAMKWKNVPLKCPQLPWQKKDGATPTVAMTHENPNTKSPYAAPRNPANLTRQNTQQTTVTTPDREVENSVQTDITTISHRYPAEDSTEGMAYVNHACSVTPTSNISAPRY